MIDFAGMSSTERKTALATLLNLLPGVDRRDEAKEVTYELSKMLQCD